MATMQLELWDRASEQPPPRKRGPNRGVAGQKTLSRPALAAGLRGENTGIAKPEVSVCGSEELQAQPTLVEPPQASRGDLLRSLRKQVSRIETGGRDEAPERISCGAAVLDQMLPGGGLAPGTVNEWVAHSDGCGAGWLSLLAAREALARAGRAGRFVALDRDGSFYPPAAIAAGIPAEQMIVVRPSDRSDLLWAADQALRSPAVAVVWGFLEGIDDRDGRRLQLAAETGRATGMFLRPARALSQPSWAEVRWYVRGVTACHALRASAAQPHSDHLSCDRPAGDRWLEARRAEARWIEARLVRCRGGRPGKSVMLHIDSAGRLHHDTPSRSASAAAVPLVAQLAHPAAAQNARRRRA